MKAIKILGPAALAMLMVLAFVVVSPAIGETTALCQEDEVPCEQANLIKHVHESTLKGQSAILLTSISNVLCEGLFLGDVISEKSLSEGKLEILGNLAYANCLDEKPNSCTLTEVSKHIILKILRETHLQRAWLTGEGEVKVVCLGISCVYNGEGLSAEIQGPLSAAEENGETRITEQTVKKVKGLLCPSLAKLDLLLTPLVPTYISS